MPRTRRLGIRYPAEGSENLASDIRDMMTDIDTLSALVASRFAACDNPGRLYVYGGNAAVGAGVGVALTYTAEVVDTEGIWAPGAPTQFFFTPGWWLIEVGVDVSCAGNITSSIMNPSWLVGAATRAIAMGSIANINNASAGFTAMGLAQIPAGAGSMTVGCVTTGGATNYSGGYVRAARIRRTV